MNKKLYVWTGDDVPNGGVVVSLAESLEDAIDDVTISLTGSNKPSVTAEWDLTFLNANPSVYIQAPAGMSA